MTACAFVIGIDEYPAATGMGPLKAAVADAVAFSEWVLDPVGGGVAHEDLYFWAWPPAQHAGYLLSAYLLNPTQWFNGQPAAAAPTDAQITQSIFEVMTQAEARGITRVYIFLAGHGIEVDRQMITERPATCFMAADYVARFADGLIACDELQQGLERIGPAEVVLLFDCCRSQLDPTSERPHLGWPNYGGQGSERLAAGRAARTKQRALEVATEGGTRGAFSHLVTFALTHFRVDDQLTAEQLENFVASRLPGLVAPLRQNSDFHIDPRDNGLILVSGPPPGPGFRFSLRFSAANRGKSAYLKNADLAVIERFDPTPDTWETMLPLGKYSLEYEDTHTVEIAHLGFGDEDVDV